MRHLLLGATLFCLLISAACASAAPTATPTMPPVTKVRFATTEVTNIRSVPLLMAIDALKAQGIEIETTNLATSTLVAEMFGKGDADMAALNNQTMWSAILKGAKARTIMQRYLTAPVILTKQEIKTCADLNGKNMGFANTSGATPALFNLYLEQNCPGTKPQLITIAQDARVAAIEGRSIDGGQFDIEQILQLAERAPGKYHVLIDLGKAYPQVQSSGINVRQEWAQAHPETVKAFVRALLMVHRQINQNPQVLYDEAVKRLDLPPVLAKQVADSYLANNTWDQNGSMTRDNLQYTLDFFFQSKALSKSMTVEEVADLSYLNAVLDEIGRK